MVFDLGAFFVSKITENLKDFPGKLIQIASVSIPRFSL
jgi:hypothetical protein